MYYHDKALKTFNVTSQYKLADLLRYNTVQLVEKVIYKLKSYLRMNVRSKKLDDQISR